MRAGFSLIELLVVLVLLGIMAAVSVPAFRGLGEEDPALETARELRELVARVRAAAIERGQTATLALDPEGGRFRVTVGSEAALEEVAEGRLQLELRFSQDGAWEKGAFGPASPDCCPNKSRIENCSRSQTP